MKDKAAKISPKLLNFEQKQLFNDDQDLLKKVITGDESWALTLKTKPNHTKGSIRRAKTEKITSSAVKCEGFARCFLRLQWHGAS